MSITEWVDNRFDMVTNEGVITSLVFNKSGECRICYSDSFAREAYDNDLLTRSIEK